MIKNSKEKNVDNGYLGPVISGSVSTGLVIHINKNLETHNKIFVGSLVTVEFQSLRYFCVANNLVCPTPGSIDSESSPIFMEFLKKYVFRTEVWVRPMLVLNDKKIFPVRAIPAAGSRATLATKDDVEAIFGCHGQGSFFKIGTALGTTAPISVDLDRICQRSIGVFGKTGTGKTFVTRAIIAGLASKNQAVCLIFDMHSEYGGNARCETRKFVPGLKTLLPEKVSIFSLDPKATASRGLQPDSVVNFGLDQIRVEDILLVADELNLHPTAVEATHFLFREFGKNWLLRLLEMSSEDIKGFAAKVGAHYESILALARKLSRLEKFDFLKKQGSEDCAQKIVDYLNRGISVILEFGRHTNLLAYLLVSGILTRKIHKSWVSASEKYVSSANRADEPKRLLVVLEEAHKFLNPTVARQTIFGMIAREMRKYYVSLMIVDQRPSKIDDEVLSQIGTKFALQLANEEDIRAVSIGCPNSSDVKSIVSTLGPKREALALGFGFAMPVAIEVREYDEEFFKTLQSEEISNADAIKEIWG